MYHRWYGIINLINNVKIVHQKRVQLTVIHNNNNKSS